MHRAMLHMAGLQGTALKSVLIAALAAMMIWAMPVQAAKVGGVDVREQLQAGGNELPLSGAGTRTRWFVDLYVAGLYVADNSRSTIALLSADEPQAVVLHITSGMVNSDRMMNATLEGFGNSTGGNTAPIQPDIDRFMTVFKDDVSEGDVYDLVYLPDSGVNVYKNGEHRQTIGDLRFKRALFGIWLGDRPAQRSLRNAMLGN